MDDSTSVEFRSAGRINFRFLAEADNTGVYAARRNLDWMLCKLPDRDQDAKQDGAVGHSFESIPAWFFRSNQESVSRFVMVVHKSCLVLPAEPYAMTVPDAFDKL